MIVADWLMSSSVLCRMGFAILLGKLICQCEVLLCVTPAQTLIVHDIGHVKVEEQGSHAVSRRQKTVCPRGRLLASNRLEKSIYCTFP